MEKFLELVAEETKFSANEILKDTWEKKKRPARPNHCQLTAQNVLELSWLGNNFQYRKFYKEFRKTFYTRNVS